MYKNLQGESQNQDDVQELNPREHQAVRKSFMGEKGCIMIREKKINDKRNDTVCHKTY